MSLKECGLQVDVSQETCRSNIGDVPLLTRSHFVCVSNGRKSKDTWRFCVFCFLRVLPFAIGGQCTSLLCSICVTCVCWNALVTRGNRVFAQFFQYITLIVLARVYAY